ncbi:transketolase [Sphingobacterium sp. FBM7-1]|uniref:transketolase n=1 Tax=Sphingobacterium sp. FBM7-1 TaxID=2886688 RepID=UPI001D1245A8|nr:transketolase [Sphingobacterium sp. FBM7-1]MCC2598906.1 transketolase [Sphingobacterium sp. FBM7-1]
MEKSLAKKSVEYRQRILKYIYQAKAGHTGGSLSCVDILNVLYNSVMNVSPSNFNSPDRDRYVQSKGHCVEALFVVLADQGFFPESELETLGRYRSHFIGHPTRKVPGVEQNTGALGHGLSLSVGMAIAAKLDQKDYKVFTLLGDGELAEGSNWEAALTAAHYELDNLCAVLDYNRMQISAPTREVCNTDPVADKFRSFGWDVMEVDGHDVEELERIFKQLPLSSGKPCLVIAHTIKGKGISYMENVLKWHHGVPNEEEYEQAQKELEESLLALD